MFWPKSKPTKPRWIWKLTKKVHLLYIGVKEGQRPWPSMIIAVVGEKGANFKVLLMVAVALLHQLLVKKRATGEGGSTAVQQNPQAGVPATPILICRTVVVPVMCLSRTVG
jgi:hypothetical protein